MLTFRSRRANRRFYFGEKRLPPYPHGLEDESDLPRSGASCIEVDLVTETIRPLTERIEAGRDHSDGITLLSQGTIRRPRGHPNSSGRRSSSHVNADRGASEVRAFYIGRTAPSDEQEHPGGLHRAKNRTWSSFAICRDFLGGVAINRDKLCTVRCKNDRVYIDLVGKISAERSELNDAIGQTSRSAFAPPRAPRRTLAARSCPIAAWMSASSKGGSNTRISFRASTQIPSKPKAITGPN